MFGGAEGINGSQSTASRAVRQEGREILIASCSTQLLTFSQLSSTCRPVDYIQRKYFPIPGKIPVPNWRESGIGISDDCLQLPSPRLVGLSRCHWWRRGCPGSDLNQSS